MTKEENRRVLLKNKKYFIIKFICSLALRAFLLAIPIYYSYGIDEITLGNFNMAYHMIFMFFIFTVLYRISEIINQITYYKLYSNLYKSYLDYQDQVQQQISDYANNLKIYTPDNIQKALNLTQTDVEEELLNRCQKIQNQIDNLIQFIAEGVAVDEVKDKMNKLIEEKKVVSNQLEKAKEQQQAKATFESIKNLSLVWNKMQFEEKREIVEHLLDKIVVNKDKMKIFWKFSINN